MNITELYKALLATGISEEKFYLHGLFGSNSDIDRLALSISKKANIPCYEIYFKERGEKNLIRIFQNENDACEYFYNRMIEKKKTEDFFK
jgi:hypothetical protein